MGLSTVTCFDSFECFLSQLLGVPTSWRGVNLAAKSKDAAAWKSGRPALENILYSETIIYKVNIMLRSVRVGMIDRADKLIRKVLIEVIDNRRWGYFSIDFYTNWLLPSPKLVCFVLYCSVSLCVIVIWHRRFISHRTNFHLNFVHRLTNLNLPLVIKMTTSLQVNETTNAHHLGIPVPFWSQMRFDIN